MIEKIFNKLLGKRPSKVFSENIGKFSLLKEDNMKTIKIIDLYILIANKEFDKLPKKFTYKGYLWEYDVKNKMWFYYFGENKKHRFDRLFYINQILNDEIKILEEEKKLPEKMPYKCSMDDANPREQFFINNVNILRDKINEILDYLESKGE